MSGEIDSSGSVVVILRQCQSVDWIIKTPYGSVQMLVCL